MVDMPTEVPDSDTGFVKERIDPAVEPAGLTKFEHLFRYRYAVRRCGTVVLDVACGVGYGSRRLWDAGKQVTGIDLSLNALSYAAKQYPGPRYICASVDRLPFPDKSFDSAIAFEIIEHLEQPSIFLDEIYRVLKPGGGVFISTPNPRHLWHALRHRFRGTPYPDKVVKENIFHHKEYPYEEFLTLLKDRGFIIRHRFGQTVLLRPLDPFFTRFGLFRLQVYLGYWIPRYAINTVVQAIKR